MIKAKQVFFWASNLKGWQSYHFVFGLKILFIVCGVWKNLFSWNWLSKSKVMAI